VTRLAKGLGLVDRISLVSMGPALQGMTMFAFSIRGLLATHGAHILSLFLRAIAQHAGVGDRLGIKGTA
jgi:hypothetical protein